MATRMMERTNTGTNSPTTGVVKSRTMAEPSHEQIRRRAYEIFLSRSASKRPGDAMSDWIQAERELRSTTTNR